MWIFIILIFLWRNVFWVDVILYEFNIESNTGLKSPFFLLPNQVDRLDPLQLHSSKIDFVKFDKNCSTSPCFLRAAVGMAHTFRCFTFYNLSLKGFVHFSLFINIYYLYYLYIIYIIYFFYIFERFCVTCSTLPCSPPAVARLLCLVSTSLNQPLETGTIII